MESALCEHKHTRRFLLRHDGPIVTNCMDCKTDISSVPASGEKTPNEWCSISGARILDPDGWRNGTTNYKGAKSWDEPVSLAEFQERRSRCTQRIPNPDSIWPPEPEEKTIALLEKELPKFTVSSTTTHIVSEDCICANCGLRGALPGELCPACQQFPSPKEKQYVAGFLFSPDYQHVVLIEKSKPEWQAGKLNGVGGKIEPGETPEQAMRREFIEEAGVDIPDWRKFCVLNWRGGAVHFFTAKGDVESVRTITEETVRRIPVDLISGYKLITNLHWLIPMAADSHIGTATVEDIS